jgi:hypothetical protein
MPAAPAVTAPASLAERRGGRVAGAPGEPAAGITPVGVVPALRAGGCLVLAPQEPAKAVT